MVIDQGLTGDVRMYHGDKVVTVRFYLDVELRMNPCIPIDVASSDAFLSSKGKQKQVVKRCLAKRKEVILRRMISGLAWANGLTEQTPDTWRRNLKSQGVPATGNGKSVPHWTSKDQFAVVLDIAQLNQAALAEYCRRKGLFVEQIAMRRDACQEANAQLGAHPRRTCAEQERPQADQGTGEGITAQGEGIGRGNRADSPQKKSPGDPGEREDD
jgi:hypothetical protein